MVAWQNACPPFGRPRVTQHIIFWIVGIALGAAGGLVMVQSFSQDHPRKQVIAWAIPLAVIGGITLGWALNAWIDYIHFTGNGGVQ